MDFPTQMDINSGGEGGQRELERERGGRKRGRERGESRLKERRERYKKMRVWGRERLEEMEKQADKKLCGGERKWEWAREIKRMGNAICVCLWDKKRERERGRERNGVQPLSAAYPLAPSVSGLDDSSWPCDLTMWPSNLVKKLLASPVLHPGPRSEGKSYNNTITQW